MRAAALETRVLASAATLDRPRQAQQRAAAPVSSGTDAETATPRKSPRTRRPRSIEENRRALDEDARALLARMPTEQEIAEAVRCRRIGAVLVEICADLGITCEHPLWQEICDALDGHGECHGNDHADILEGVFQRVGKVVEQLPAEIPPLAPAAWDFGAAPAATGPP